MSEKYALIAAEQADPSSSYPVVLMCRALRVSRSGYYEWATGAVSARARRRAVLAEHVTAAFAAGRGTYGVRRVHAVLACSDDAQVATASLRLVRDLMHELDLYACQPRAYRGQRSATAAPAPPITSGATSPPPSPGPRWSGT